MNQKLPTVQLSHEDAIEFNQMMHQAIVFGHDTKQKTKGMFKVWKWFITKHTTMKSNSDYSIGHDGFKFAVVFLTKEYVSKDTLNNMVACHNLFRDGGDLHVL